MKPREQITLIDILIDGFEQNEFVGGMHRRQLPLPDFAVAVAKFAELVEEATRWKGTPVQTVRGKARELAAWEDVELRRTGQMILVRVRTAGFGTWWHNPATWEVEGADAMAAWLREDQA